MDVMGKDKINPDFPLPMEPTSTTPDSNSTESSTTTTDLSTDLTSSGIDTDLHLPKSAEDVEKHRPGTFHLDGPRISLATASSLPTKSRVIQSITPPPTKPLNSNLLWDNTGLPNLDVLKDHLFKEGRLHIEDAIKIVQWAGKILEKEPNLLEIEAPITICGDIHGQYYDLMKLFEVGGGPGTTKCRFTYSYILLSLSPYYFSS